MRLFVGIPSPPGPYEALTNDLLKLAPDVRPVPPGSWHVTLRFLGEVDGPTPVVSALDEALARASALPCRLAAPGAFPKPSQARVAWVGLEAAGLEALAARVVQATAGFGQLPDRRRFRPHVTLARLRQPRDVRPWVARSTASGGGLLDEVVLYRSDLTAAGPVYTAVRRWAMERTP